MAGTYRYRIEPRDIDATLRVRIYTMGDLVLQAANDDADMLGFGVRDLNAGVGSAGIEASWVLSRMAVEMRRLPRRHEQIDVYTWVSDYGRLVTTRNMVISDGDGLEIGAVVTQWAMIDLTTRRPLDLSALSDKGTSLVDREPPIEPPRKIPALKNEVFVKSAAMQRSREICEGSLLAVNDQANSEGKEAEVHFSRKTVVYSDIDFNGHVNSMKYLEWMVDALPVEVLTGIEGMRFDINYIHEARLGDLLTVCRGWERPQRDGSEAGEPDTHLFDIRNAEGISICKAAIRVF